MAINTTSSMITFRVDNNIIPRVINQLTSNKRRFFERAGQFCVARMDEYVAVDTGNLKAHNGYRASDNDFVIYNDENDYNLFQEFGTVNQPGTPFIRPAVYNHFNDISNIAREELGYGF